MSSLKELNGAIENLMTHLSVWMASDQPPPAAVLRKLDAIFLEMGALFERYQETRPSGDWNE